MRPLLLPLVLASGLALSGCIASIASTAVNAAVAASNADRNRVVAEDRRQPATAACTARGQQHGTVHIIDVEQRPNGVVTIWGTVQDATQRRSFECIYKTKLEAFRLRAIRTPAASR